MLPNEIASPSTTPKRIYIITAVIAVFLAGTIVFVAMRFAKTARDNKVIDDAATALGTLDAEKIATAVPVLEISLESLSPDKAAQAKILLARTTFWSATPDRAKAVRLLMEVGRAEDYPPFFRAFALELLTEMVLHQGVAFATEHIMSEEPFRGWYREQGYDAAVRMIDELGDSIFPLPVTNQRIARWYANRLITNRLAPAPVAAEALQLVGQLQYRVARADTLAKQIPDDYWSDDRRLRYHDLRAKTLSKRYLLSGSDRDRTEALASFETALALAKSVFMPKGYTSDLPYQYAVFLAEIGAEPSVIEPVAALAGITNLSTSTTNARERALVDFFVAENAQGHEGHYHHREILLLARANEPFRRFLEAIGWDSAVLEASLPPISSAK